jgi:hypothetical protein
MARYEPEDIVTYYFVIYEGYTENVIKGWTDDKDLAKFFMEFHKCKNYRLKKLTKTMKEIGGILNNNAHEEISMAEIHTRDRKRNGEVKLIMIPMTRSELNFIQAETGNFVAGYVNYTAMYDTVQFLKNKYRRALDILLLTPIMNNVCQNEVDEKHNLLQYVDFDQLAIMYKCCPHEFG